MKRFVLALFATGAMMFMTPNMAEAYPDGWGSASGYGSTGMSGVQRFRTRVALRTNFVGGGCTGMVRARIGQFRARIGQGRVVSWVQNRRVAPLRNMRERRAQRLATLVDHGQELNTIQEMGSSHFMLVPEANTKQIIITPQPVTIEPDMSLLIYDTPKFVLVSTRGVVAVETSSPLTAKMQQMRQNRQGTGNAKSLFVVVR